MHNKKRLIFFVILLIAVQATQAKQSWPLIDFDEIERFFDQQFEEFNQRVRNQKISQPSLSLAIPAITSHGAIPLEPISVSIQETDEHVLISIKQIDTEDIDARLNDENTQLTLCTPDNKIEIEIDNNYVQIKIVSIQKQDNSTDQYMATIGESVSGNPEFGDQTIDYDPASGILNITIPKRIEVKGKSVPVIIKQTDPESSENEK